MAVKVLTFKAVTQLAVILCAVDCSVAADVSICVKSNEAAVCQQQNTEYSSFLTELPALLENYSAVQTLHVHLTGGTHSLNTSLNFTNREVEIQGSWTEKSVIQCRNVSGLKFEDSIVVIENLTIQKCLRTVNFNNQDLHTALYFRNVNYTLTNTAVTESAGHGLVAIECKHHTIKNCSFRNNMVHIKMENTNPNNQISNNQILSVTIKETEFCDGFGDNNGLHIYVSSSRIQMRLSID